jgi:hypothetical protein
MKHLLAALALLGLLISATLHFSTYLGFDLLDSYPGAWLLHVALFVVFIPAIPAFYLLQGGGCGGRLTRGSHRVAALLAASPGLYYRAPPGSDRRTMTAER